MDKKLVITALYNEKKTIKYEQSLFKEKDGGMYMNFTESIITQMVKARDEDQFKAICERIQDFIEREGIDVCFAINQNELLDCLDEHKKLKLQIADLETKLTKSEKLNKRLQQVIDKLRDKEFAGKHLVEAVNAVYEPLYQNKYDEAEQLKQQLAEKNELFIAIKWRVDDLEKQLAEKNIEIERLKQNYDEVWEDTYFSVREEFELNNNCNECRRYYAEEFNKQLAEKDAEVQSWKDGTMVVKLGKLEEQLAEKEKEIEELKKGVYKVTLGTTSSNQIDFTENFYVIQNQKAIDELEKVKEKVLQETNRVEERFSDGLQSGFNCCYVFTRETIDQQIKSLKGDK